MKGIDVFPHRVYACVCACVHHLCRIPQLNFDWMRAFETCTSRRVGEESLHRVEGKRKKARRRSRLFGNHVYLRKLPFMGQLAERPKVMMITHNPERSRSWRA